MVNQHLIITLYSKGFEQHMHRDSPLCSIPTCIQWFHRKYELGCFQILPLCINQNQLTPHGLLRTTDKNQLL